MTQKKEESDVLRIFRDGPSDIFLKKEPRFGTWSVSFQTGVVPEQLKGAWQEAPVLIQKIEYYLANRRFNKVNIKLKETNDGHEEEEEEKEVKGPKKKRVARG